MIRKAALALVAILSMSTIDMAPARADVDIDINIGYGGWGVIGVGPGRGSCRYGLRVIERRFNRVQVRDCRGQVYTYYGRRNGKWFLIRMSAYTGRIIGVQRIYR